MPSIVELTFCLQRFYREAAHHPHEIEICMVDNLILTCISAQATVGTPDQNTSNPDLLEKTMNRVFTASFCPPTQSTLRRRAIRPSWPFDHSLCTAVASYGVSALLALASRWHGRLFSVDLCGSVERFWEFLRLTNVVEKVSKQARAWFYRRPRVLCRNEAAVVSALRNKTPPIPGPRCCLFFLRESSIRSASGESTFNSDVRLLVAG